LAYVAVTALILSGCGTAVSSKGVRSTPTGYVVGSIALGVNVAAWDSVYTGSEAPTINGLLKSAGISLLRYPGGSWADEYDWASNTDSSKCTNGVTASCAASDALDFDAFSSQAHAMRASTFVTVNYGSGTAATATSWMAHSEAAKDRSVALWEVGNETYSCYETNQHLANSPTYVKGYTPDGSVCPGTSVMARSYVANAAPYVDAMKAELPTAEIGVPWAFTGAQAAGAGVKDASVWNTSVLQALGNKLGFVDAHWYPFDSTSSLTAEQIVQSVRRIPSAAADIRNDLHRYAPQATFVIGETSITERPSTLDFQPVSALFAAATSLEWLSQGAESVDWWDLNNFGTPTTGDYGLVTSGSPEPGATGTPLPPYYGERMASLLTEDGSRITALPMRSASLLGFESTLRDERRVLLVNATSSDATTVVPSGFKEGALVRISTYSASTASTTVPITGTSELGPKSITLPAESIVVLSGTSGS
jgi:hypothetical protein